MGTRYVIVGNGAAGMAAAERIRERDPLGQVTVVAAESRPSYFRPLIPHLIAQDLPPEQLFRSRVPAGVAVLSGHQATALHPAERLVALADGERLPYDRLLLATGASPYLPPVPGLARDDALVLRTWDDAEAIRAACPAGAGRALIVGGGRVGVKSALALQHLGLQVTVLEALPRVIPLQLDETASALVQQALEAEGIRFELGRQVTRVLAGPGDVRAVLLDDGRQMEAELLIVAAGVRPNVQLAEGAGIRVRSGVVVDECLRTSLPDVYAAGDVAETADLVGEQPIVSGTWTNAVEMGRCAGDNLAGQASTFRGALAVFNAMELAGLPLISVGQVNPQGEGYDVEVRRQARCYQKLVYRGDRLVGALLVGDVERAGVYTALIRGQQSLGPMRGRLLGGRGGYAHFLAAPAPTVDHYIYSSAKVR